MTLEAPVHFLATNIFRNSFVWFFDKNIFGYSSVSYSYHFLDTNIFGYSFASFFIQIYLDIPLDHNQYSVGEAP